ncbi:unnamed protein product, partial [Mesorhabditis belari]|uniref:Major facilitator superfamily (MFS) profile domain-containing protein n=1 Tax=Mesorhabditis belari TaxID=2138241 RepID=A0AAF3JCC9_9BILA
MRNPKEKLLNENEMAPTKIDDFLRLGRYSLLICIACELVVLMQAGNLLFMVFGGAPPKLIACQNDSSVIDLPEGILCEMYHNGTCDPRLEYSFNSVNVEFNYICGDSSSIKDSTSIQMIGYVIGTLIFGQISDHFGRKLPMLITVLLTGIFGFASSFAHNLYTFTALRFLAIFFNTGHVVIVVVFMCETLPMRHRMWLNFLINWSPNILLVTCFAFILGDWRKLSILINLLAIPICILLFFSEESVYWLVRKGKIEEALETIEKMGKIDGKTMDLDGAKKIFEEERQQAQKTASRRYFFHHLFYSWTLVSYSITMFASYMCVGIFNYGIMFNLETLSGSLYNNMITVASLRMILNLSSAAADFKLKWLGRLTAHYIFGGYATCAVLGIIVIQYFGLELTYSLLVRWLVISASSMASQIFLTNQVTCSEIYPTPIRNIAYAMTQLSGSTGSILGAQLFKLSELSIQLPYLLTLQT